MGGGVSMVQGASRGIGLEFVKQLLEKNEKGHVIATCSDPAGATGRLQLKKQFAERLNVLPLDLTVESTIEVHYPLFRFTIAFASSMSPSPSQVAKMVSQKFTVDLNKPLVFQVGHLGENYQEWVHQPIVSKEGPRLFESDFWESLTLTVWWAIPTIWLPVACWFISMSVRMGNTLPEIVLMVALGVFVWTLAEYILHRFLFHIETKSYWGNTIHYLLHGIHHKHPTDSLRLVFPPAAAAILSIPFWNLVKLCSTPSTAPALFGGVLLGYAAYDCTHYYLHHAQPTNQVPKRLKKYHLNHHFRIQNKGFGITSAFWDRVFGTLPQTKASEKAR